MIDVSRGSRRTYDDQQRVACSNLRRIQVFRFPVLEGLSWQELEIFALLTTGWCRPQPKIRGTEYSKLEKAAGVFRREKMNITIAVCVRISHLLSSALPFLACIRFGLLLPSQGMLA